MRKSTAAAIAIVLVLLAAFAENGTAQTSAIPQPTALDVPLLPPLLKGVAESKFNGREYRIQIEMDIAKQDGRTGVGTYTRFNSYMLPPCNHYNHAPMTFQWDGAKLDVAVLKGDQCERLFSLARGVEHYFVLDDPNGNFHVYFDAAK